MLWRLGVLAPVLPTPLIVGCSGAAPLEEARTPTLARSTLRRWSSGGVAPGAQAVPDTTVGAASPVAVPDDGPDTPSPQPFADGCSGFKADTVLAVGHGEHQGYERIVLALGVGEEPAGGAPLDARQPAGRRPAEDKSPLRERHRRLGRGVRRRTRGGLSRHARPKGRHVRRLHRPAGFPLQGAGLRRPGAARGGFRARGSVPV